MVVSADSNLSVYGSPEVAAYYEQLDYLSPSERLLFERYVKRGDRILDLGVGGGRTTPYLAELASDYVGVDYSQTMVLACRKKFPTIAFVTADAADLSQFGDHSFDVAVMAFNGLDYVMPDFKRVQALAEIRRVLKPGGVFIFSSHNPRSILQRPSWNSKRIGNIARGVAREGTSWYRIVRWCLTTLRVSIAWMEAVAFSLVKCIRRLSSRPFWSGNGWMMDPAHGGLMTHYAVPRCVVDELSSAGFMIRETLGDDHPARSHDYWTDWYYYVVQTRMETGAQPCA